MPARRAGIALDMQRFDEISREIPVLANVRPSGKYLMEDFFYAGGIRALMSRLRDILYPGQRQTPVEDIDRLEEENFAWIDFLWSTLGRSGQVGEDMALIATAAPT